MAESNSRILKRDYGFDVAATRREVLRLVELRPGQRALDIGTGEGSMAFALARRKLRVIGVDTDRESLRVARLRGKRAGVQLRKRVRFVYGDALALPFSAGEFDVVFSFDTLHHLSQCADAVGEMLRVCSDTGVVAIADLNRKGLRAIDEVMARYGDEHYHNSCRVNVVGQILKQQGVPYKRYALPFVTLLVARKPVQRAADDSAVRLSPSVTELPG